MQIVHRHRTRRAYSRLPAAVVVVSAAAVLLTGCGGAGGPPPSVHGPRRLTRGHRRAPVPRRRGPAVRLAYRFARAYAEGAYRRRPPEIGAEDAAVRRELAAAAARVPPVRRGLRPRLLGLRLWLHASGSLGAAARVGDGHLPPFSVGFTVGRRGGRWVITSISPPG